MGAIAGIVDPEFQKSVNMIKFEFKKDLDKFDTPAFLTRLEAEINKVFQLMRFFTLLKTRAN